MEFWKMNGAGNDFVVVDNRKLDVNLSTEQIEQLCDRQRGVGADGLLAVEPAANGADFRMRYYNADGGEAEMCGNGARCFARFVNRLHADGYEKMTFETPAGVISATFDEEIVSVGLSEPFDLQLHLDLLIQGEKTAVHSVNTGVPHAIVIVDDIESADIRGIGREIRFHEFFAPKGTNANVMQVTAENAVSLRTYERGVEDETLACGTGMVAAAIIHHELTGVQTPIAVKVRGGDTLRVDFRKTEAGTYEDVWLTGPADFVFNGSIEPS